MFLVLAARKLQLRREINEKNYQQMLIQDQLTTATKKVEEFQQFMNDAKQMINVFAQGMGNQALLNAYATKFGADSETYQKIVSGRSGELTEDELKEVSAIQNTAATSANQVTAAVSNVTNSIFQQANKTQLAMLQAQQSSLDLKNEALKSQVKTLSEEYNAVKSSEDQAAKSCAPEFGIA